MVSRVMLKSFTFGFGGSRKTKFQISILNMDKSFPRSADNLNNSSSTPLSGWSSVAIHGGHSEDPLYAHQTPIYASSTYVFDTAEQGMRRFSGEEEGFIYSRWGNPTIFEAEQKIAALETFGLGIETKAILHASGMAAIAT